MAVTFSRERQKLQQKRKYYYTSYLAGTSMLLGCHATCSDGERQVSPIKEFAVVNYLSRVLVRRADIAAVG